MHAQACSQSNNQSINQSIKYTVQVREPNVTHQTHQMHRDADAWLVALQARLTRDGWAPATMRAIQKLLQPPGDRAFADSEGMMQSVRGFIGNIAPSLAGVKELADEETDHEAFKVSMPGTHDCSAALLVAHGSHQAVNMLHSRLF